MVLNSRKSSHTPVKDVESVQIEPGEAYHKTKEATMVDGDKP
jgi:hypothetical protein